jgi:energy-coupling factor transporter transmembrane protein EcfT
MIEFEFMDYSASPFNPRLKIVIFILFCVTAVVYYDARRTIGGEIRKIIDLLLIFSLFMALGSIFRYFGHGTDFGFNSDYSLKGGDLT